MTKPTATPPEDAVALVMARNHFYRDSHHLLVILCFLLICLIAAMTGFIYLQHINRPTPTYFATTPDGKLIDLVPRNRPNLRTNTLLNWATDAATSVYNFDFVHYREQLQTASEFFTVSGYKNFLAALQQSNNLKAVKEKKLVVSAVASGAPVILDEGVLEGIYAWKIQLPMLITYQSVNEFFKQNVIVEMLIIRESTIEKPRGVAIQYMLVKAKTGGERA